MSEQKEHIPPGELLRDELQERGWTQDDLARIIGRPLAAVSEVIMGHRAITAQTAQELSAAFGTSPEYWLNLETAYQLALSEGGVPVEEVRMRARLFAESPVKEMEKRGWIRRSSSASELQQEICRFYGVRTIDEEPKLKLAARQSVSDSALTPAQIAWCYRALHLAPAVRVPKFDLGQFVKSLPELRVLARHPESARNVPKALGLVGVKFLVIERLIHTRMDGAVLWHDGSPVIVLSLRHDRLDWFWHTLQHEISHILEGDTEPRLDVEINSSDDDPWAVSPIKERAANETAADRMIPAAKLESFITRAGPSFSADRIIQFAHVVGVHPAIVVGQIQHRLEDFRVQRRLLVKVRQHVVGHALTDGFGFSPDVR